MSRYFRYVQALLTSVLVHAGCGGLDHPAVQLNLDQVPSMAGEIDITLTMPGPGAMGPPGTVPTSTVNGMVAFYRAASGYQNAMPMMMSAPLGPGPSAVSVILDLPPSPGGMVTVKVAALAPPTSSGALVVAAGGCTQVILMANQLVVSPLLVLTPQTTDFVCPAM